MTILLEFQAYYRVTFYSEKLKDKLKSRGMKDESQLMDIQRKLEDEAKAHLGKGWESHIFLFCTYINIAVAIFDN